MPPGPYNLAIETSSRFGGVALGRGDVLLEAAELPEQRRHAVELLPAIDGMCRRHSVTPADLGEVYVSVGPGSFTGLRVGVTTAKVLGRAIGCRLVAVPTLDAVARNGPPDRPHIAVMLNAKAGRWFTGLYELRGEEWVALIEAALLTPAELLDRRARLWGAGDPERPLAVIADRPPDFGLSDGVECLGPALATPRVEAVWRIGRRVARGGRFTDPRELTPLYVRLPEAEEVWRAKQET